MFAGNMGDHKLNSIHYIWGNVEPGIVNRMYAFQSYYYYADCLFFFITKWFNLLHVNFYPTLSFVWTFQIVFFASIASIITKAIQYFSNKKQLLLISIAILMLFYVRYQFNSVYGFFGNTLKAISLSYSSLSLYLYFKDYNKGYLYLFYCSLLATVNTLTNTGNKMIEHSLTRLLLCSYKIKKAANKYKIVTKLPEDVNEQDANKEQ